MARIKQEDRQQVLDQTRQRLLEAAAVEFSRAGYEGANINIISTAAGYAKGTVYNYFPSKRALLLALIDAVAQLHFEFIVTQVRAEPGPAQRLERLYRAGFDFVARYLVQARVLFNTLNGADEELKTHIFAAYQPMFQFVAEEILVPGMAEGIFRPVEPVSTAILLLTIYLGTASQHDGEGHPRLDPAQVAGLALNGLHS